MSEKKCSKCGETKEVSEFYKKHTSKDGLQSSCKDCKRKIDQKWHNNNKEKEDIRRKKHHKENREKEYKQYKERSKKAMESSPLHITYSAIHKWAKTHVPKPNFCVICNEIKDLQLASINHSYTKNIEDWMWLCQSCHILFDRINGKYEVVIIG